MGNDESKEEPLGGLPTTIAITGCAGFIGGHTAKILLDRGTRVIGLDCLSADLYPAETKQTTINSLRENALFTFHQLDLRHDELRDAIEPAEAIIHFSALAGLTMSWSSPELYHAHNVLATERLLEAVALTGAKHVVHASTSSVYGADATGAEDLELRPISPYGETKLAAEQRVRSAEENGSLTATILRYFSVYGPEQRPDMAYSMAIQAIIHGSEMLITGDGSQSRSNTYVHDAAMAAVLAVEKKPSATMNICGDESISLLESIRFIETVIGRPARLNFVDEARGDQKVTLGDFKRASDLLGWRPTTGIRQGLRLQIAAAMAVTVNESR